MVPWGGAEAMLGNNPFAVAFPMRDEAPIVLDMACSVAARGKIIVAAKEGEPIPADWAVDRDGRPDDRRPGRAGGVRRAGRRTEGIRTDATIGLLSTMLSGAYFGSEVTHMYDDLEHPQNIGHLFGVLPIGRSRPLDTLFRAHGQGGGRRRGVRLAQGVERVYLPGEREAMLAQQREARRHSARCRDMARARRLGRQACHAAAPLRDGA